MKFAVEDLIPLLDLTSLNEVDSEGRIVELCDKACTPYGHVAALCIAPRFVELAVERLANTAVSVATVVNFPTGNEPLVATSTLIQNMLANGAKEIDAVFPYESYMRGNKNEALEFVRTCRALCGREAKLKIILETGALVQAALIAEVTSLAITGGADFIKTSTGKIPAGVTLQAATVILHEIKKHKDRLIGFKVSGGVRSIDQAMLYVGLVNDILGADYLQPARFRIGASQLLDAILLQHTS